MSKTVTKEQIYKAFGKVKSGADFPQLVQDLKDLGLRYYENFVADGKTNYVGPNDYSVRGEAKYPEMKVAEQSSKPQLQQALKIHQAGQTDYPTFCQQAAEAGVEKWITSMDDMTVSYYDKDGNVLLVEEIPEI